MKIKKFFITSMVFLLMLITVLITPACNLNVGNSAEVNPPSTGQEQPDKDKDDATPDGSDKNDGEEQEKPDLPVLKTYKQNLNYAESVERINNPDQGFYRPMYVRVTESSVTYNINIVNDSTQLYHLRIDISAFSEAVNEIGDKDLTDRALNGLRELFTFLKSNDKNAVVRFAYDPNYGGVKDMEPSPQQIQKHIEQVGTILTDFKSTITAVEAGLIGPWGEMHSSKIANSTYISPIIEALLTNVTDLPVLVRTPKMIYDYLGITVNDIENYTIESASKEYRLGLYNDGYLGSGNDLGTYTNREKEIAFLSKQTNHLPFGGEVVVPGSDLHDIDKCLPEMFQIHLNYLNIEWNYEVIDKWKNCNYTADCGTDEIYYGKSAFTYIENHMGYRFVLTNSVFEYSDKFDKLNISLNLKNVGFGNLNKAKFAKLIFVDGSGEAAFTKQVENFYGEESVGYSVPLNLQNGKYEVYLCLYGEEAEGAPLYSLQFANDLWNATLKANKIGEIEIK